MAGIILGNDTTIDFTTHNPNTAQVSDADVLPTVEVFEENTDVAILAPVAAKRAAKTGDYRVTFSVTTANGFEVGKVYNVIAEATVAGITAKARINNFSVVSATSSVIPAIVL